MSFPGIPSNIIGFRVIFVMANSTSWFSTSTGTVSCSAFTFTLSEELISISVQLNVLVFPCRYNLPFRPASHHAVSPNRIVLPLYTDLMELRAGKEALRFSWNRAWHCGTDALLTCRRGSSAHTPE